jgi:hypothetical protein
MLYHEKIKFEEKLFDNDDLIFEKSIVFEDNDS